MTGNPRARQDIRLFPIDFLRGLLMVLMALDHANFHISQQHSSGEYWGGPFPVFSTPMQFLVRFVTHLCAPGFFFTLGIGMVLFTSSRSKKGWNESKIWGHFLVRGFVLIALQIILNYGQVWSVAGSPALRWYVGVLAALGFGMILCVPLLRLKPKYLAWISLGLFVIMEVLTPDALLWGKNFDQFAGTLLIFSGGIGEFWSNYPLLAWVELIVLGILFGKLILEDARTAYQNGAWLGLIFLTGFGLLRALNGFGNIRPLPKDNWMGFLSLVKYPPSMTFVLLTIGINLILLWAFSKVKEPIFGEMNPLLVYGRAPLFFYLAHVWVYLLMGRLITPEGSNLAVMFVLWLVGLFILYIPVRWYGHFKSRQIATSWVRFL